MIIMLFRIQFLTMDGRQHAGRQAAAAVTPACAADLERQAERHWHTYKAWLEPAAVLMGSALAYWTMLCAAPPHANLHVSGGTSQ
jgi:hypothetical protein